MDKFKFKIDSKTQVMGILNITPDSFSDGGLWFTPEKAVKRALEIQKEGASILDIGAQSTRPGFTAINEQEELKRMMPVLTVLRKEIKIPISVDTFYPEVAQMALLSGAQIINDVLGTYIDEMLTLVNKFDAGYISVHNQKNIDTIEPFFKEVQKKAKKLSVSEDKICFDPGVGFNKTREEDLSIIRNLKEYTVKGRASLIGLSRKRVIGYCCGEPPFERRLPGTIAANTVAILNGASIIRVHDVKEAVQAAKIADALKILD